MHKPGDKVRIFKKDGIIEGLLMPNEETDSVVIKLTNGYNIGIDKNKIKRISVLKKKEEKSSNKIRIKPKNNLKNIVILHTGGTIASKVDYGVGGVIAQFSTGDMLSMIPELADIANIKTELVENMMSEDISFTEYKKIISRIKKYMGKCDGIIIGHGTDTLAYTAASLAFALENIKIPVILVGSQRSSDRASSDAAINLICAAKFITKSNFKGVAICMHHTIDDNTCAILPATKTRKMHTSRRDAFKSINDRPIALIEPKSGRIEHKKEFEDNKGAFVCKDKFSERVVLLKSYPNLSNKLLEFMTKNFDAIVVEGTGLGHMPTNTKSNLKNYETLKNFIKKGGIVAITSQCIFGRVHPNVYANLRRLSNIGCVFCEDMLSETAFIKLSWLLGNYKDKDKIKELMKTNLRGEINPRIGPGEYL